MRAMNFTVAIAPSQESHNTDNIKRRKSMAEAASVIGTIGFTLGVVSFLASTVENLAIRYNKYKKCAHKLQHYARKIRQLNREYEEWCSLWAKEPRSFSDSQWFSETTYVFFWGVEGNTEISILTQSLKRMFEEIFRSFQCKDAVDIAVDDIAHWLDIIEDIKNKRSTQGIIKHTPPNWLEKIAFAVYKDSIVKDRISDLEDSLLDLSKASVSLFKGRHRNRFKWKDSDTGYLEGLRTLQEDRKSFAKAVHNFSEECKSSAQSSSVHWVLGTPTLKEAHKRFWDKLRVPLTVNFEIESDRNCQPIDFIYPRDRGKDPHSFRQPETITEHSKRQDLDFTRIGSYQLAKMAERSLAALSVARLVILFYPSEHQRDICSCMIRFTRHRSLLLTWMNASSSSTCSGHDYASFLYQCSPHGTWSAYESMRDLVVFLLELISERNTSTSEVPYMDTRRSSEKWTALMEYLEVKMNDFPLMSMTPNFLRAVEKAYRVSEDIRFRSDNLYLADDFLDCMEIIEAELKTNHMNIAKKLAEKKKEMSFIIRYPNCDVSLAKLVGKEAALELEGEPDEEYVPLLAEEYRASLALRNPVHRAAF